MYTSRPRSCEDVAVIDQSRLSICRDTGNKDTLQQSEEISTLKDVLKYGVICSSYYNSYGMTPGYNLGFPFLTFQALASKNS